MAEAGETRRTYILLDAFDPDTNGLCKVQISHQRMQTVETFAHITGFHRHKDFQTAGKT